MLGSMFRFVVVPLIIILLALKLFATRVYERELYVSDSATVVRNQITIGSEGYGIVSSVEVKPGDQVEKGKILYRYFNAELDQKIFAITNSKEAIDTKDELTATLNNLNQNVDFIVRAKSAGLIDSVNITPGEYVTKDSITMKMEEEQTFVDAEIRIDRDELFRIYAGLTAKITFPDGRVIFGEVSSVSPKYNITNNTLKTQIKFNKTTKGNDFTENDMVIFSNTPVQVKILSKDTFTNQFNTLLESTQQPLLISILKYEVL